MGLGPKEPVHPGELGDGADAVGTSLSTQLERTCARAHGPRNTDGDHTRSWCCVKLRSDVAGGLQQRGSEH